MFIFFLWSSWRINFFKIKFEQLEYVNTDARIWWWYIIVQILSDIVLSTLSHSVDNACTEPPHTFYTIWTYPFYNNNKTNARVSSITRILSDSVEKLFEYILRETPIYICITWILVNLHVVVQSIPTWYVRTISKGVKNG